MREAINRAIRTFFQAWIGVFLGLTVVNPGEIPERSLLAQAAVAASWAGLVAVLSWLQNALEEAGAVPRVLK